MTTTSILRSRAAIHAGVNDLCSLEHRVADIYAQLRHRLGPEAPARFFELEGAHRNRSARLEQRLREHLLVPVPTPNGPSTFSGLATRLDEQHDIGELFVLLRELERELLHAYEHYEDTPAEDNHEIRHASWIATSMFPDQQQTLAILEEECARPRRAAGAAIPHQALNPLTGSLGDSARGF